MTHWPAVDNAAFYWARELVFTVNTTWRSVPNRSVNSRSRNHQSTGFVSWQRYCTAL